MIDEIVNERRFEMQYEVKASGLLLNFSPQLAIQ